MTDRTRRDPSVPDGTIHPDVLGWIDMLSDKTANEIMLIVSTSLTNRLVRTAFMAEAGECNDMVKLVVLAAEYLTRAAVKMNKPPDPVTLERVSSRPPPLPVPSASTYMMTFARGSTKDWPDDPDDM